MTNKIYLSFNRLYSLKDGDYHGANLSFKIKHGDQVIAEGKREGKSLSQFISSIPIEEMDVTKPLTVEYICTGNVEDVSASVNPLPDFDNSSLADCKKRFAGSEPLPFGGFPGAELCQAQVAKPQPPETITTKAVAFGVTISWEGSNNIPYESRIQVQWIKDDHFLSTTDHKVVSSEKSHTITGLKAGEEIYCRLRVVSASGQKSEWSGFVKQAASSDAQELLNNVLANYSASMRIGVNAASESTEENRIKNLVTKTVTEHITKMQQPGGILWNRR